MTTDIRAGVRLARAVALPALVLLSVVAIGFALSSADEWTASEMDVLRAVNLHHTGALDRSALAINWFFGPPMASLLVLTAGIVIAAVTRRVSPALHFLVIVVVPWLGSEAVKLVVHRARPDIPSLAHPLILEPGGLSFPSGHTTFAACLALGVIVTVGRTRWRPLVIGAAIATSAATAASRVYLGVHYPTDVVAAIIYSVAAVMLVNTLWVQSVVPHWSQPRRTADAVSTYRGAPNAR